jgi:acetyl esterase/lipase
MRRGRTFVMIKRLTVTLLLFAIFISTGIAQQPQQTGVLEDPPWLKEFAFKRIVYSVPGMTRVKVVKDRVYKRVGSAELKMDVYSPLTRGAQRPAVIFIHGGRIPPNLRTTPKEWGAYVSFGQLVAASGFVGVTFNHRFYTWDSLPDSQSDLTDLITHVRNNADALGVDKDRIILWAVSAGGVFLAFFSVIRCAMRSLTSAASSVTIRNSIYRTRARLRLRQ